MIVIILLLLTGICFADSTIDTTYHYDSRSMGGQAWEDRPLTPVGSNYAAKQDAPPPVDYSKVLVSGAREKHTDIVAKPVMTQEEMNRLNKEIRDLKQDVAMLKEHDPHGVRFSSEFSK